MEAIGTLSAGIAHDFNNILTAILGFADLGFEDAPADSKAKRHLARILRAAQRGKDLVTQILSFSRKGEEELMPTVLAPVVKESTKMLRASLPKTIEIRGDITTEPSHGPRRSHADPANHHEPGHQRGPCHVAKGEA